MMTEGSRVVDDCAALGSPPPTMGWPVASVEVAAAAAEVVVEVPVFPPPFLPP
jgi:hypothetical protein